MKFNCAFINPDTDEEHTIFVELTAEEIKSADKARDRDMVDLYQKVFALRAAYRIAPPGFVHIAHGTRAVLLN